MTARHYRSYILFAVIIALVMPLCAHADWENGLAVSINRTVNKLNVRLLCLSISNMVVALANIFLKKKWLTSATMIILALQLLHVVIAFNVTGEEDEYPGAVALMFFVFTACLVFLGKTFGKKAT